MIHLKTTCDSRRVKNDGTLPIVFHITVYGNMRTISSGFSCHNNNWDFKKNSVKEKTENLTLLGKRVKDADEHNTSDEVSYTACYRPWKTLLIQLHQYFDIVWCRILHIREQQVV